MVSDEELNVYRIDGSEVRVVRDADEANDVKGTVIAWDSESLLIRKRNRRVVKLPRRYPIQLASEPRQYDV